MSTCARLDGRESSSTASDGGHSDKCVLMCERAANTFARRARAPTSGKCEFQSPHSEWFRGLVVAMATNMNNSMHLLVGIGMHADTRLLSRQPQSVSTSDTGEIKYFPLDRLTVRAPRPKRSARGRHTVLVRFDSDGRFGWSVGRRVCCVCRCSCCSCAR